MNAYQKAADRLLHSRYAVALTGAGISVESGIPDFRSADGLWSRYDPMEFGHIEAFRRNPGKVWKMLLEMDALLSKAVPNTAHLILAQLENRGVIKAVITQNVDSLHQRAGSRMVVEFHGHNRTLRCDRCGSRVRREAVSLDLLPPLCTCSEALRPDFVFFGEAIPEDAYSQALAAAEQCDLMLLIGTSATVAPASYIPVMAKENDAFLLEINPNETELTHRLTDLHIAEPAGKALSAILSEFDRGGSSKRN